MSPYRILPSAVVGFPSAQRYLESLNFYAPLYPLNFVDTNPNDVWLLITTTDIHPDDRVRFLMEYPTRHSYIVYSEDFL